MALVDKRAKAIQAGDRELASTYDKLIDHYEERLHTEAQSRQSANASQPNRQPTSVSLPAYSAATAPLLATPIPPPPPPPPLYYPPHSPPSFDWNATHHHDLTSSLYPQMGSYAPPAYPAELPPPFYHPPTRGPPSYSSLQSTSSMQATSSNGKSALTSLAQLLEQNKPQPNQLVDRVRLQPPHAYPIRVNITQRFGTALCAAQENFPDGTLVVFERKRNYFIGRVEMTFRPGPELDIDARQEATDFVVRIAKQEDLDAYNRNLRVGRQCVPLLRQVRNSDLGGQADIEGMDIQDCEFDLNFGIMRVTYKPGGSGYVKFPETARPLHERLGCWFDFFKIPVTVNYEPTDFIAQRTASHLEHRPNSTTQAALHMPPASDAIAREANRSAVPRGDTFTYPFTAIVNLSATIRRFASKKMWPPGTAVVVENLPGRDLGIVLASRERDVPELTHVVLGEATSNDVELFRRSLDYRVDLKELVTHRIQSEPETASMASLIDVRAVLVDIDVAVLDIFITLRARVDFAILAGALHKSLKKRIHFQQVAKDEEVADHDLLKLVTEITPQDDVDWKEDTGTAAGKVSSGQVKRFSSHAISAVYPKTRAKRPREDSDSSSSSSSSVSDRRSGSGGHKSSHSGGVRNSTVSDNSRVQPPLAVPDEEDNVVAGRPALVDVSAKELEGDHIRILSRKFQDAPHWYWDSTFCRYLYRTDEDWLNANYLCSTLVLQLSAERAKAEGLAFDPVIFLIEAGRGLHKSNHIRWNEESGFYQPRNPYWDLKSASVREYKDIVVRGLWSEEGIESLLPQGYTWQLRSGSFFADTKDPGVTSDGRMVDPSEEQQREIASSWIRRFQKVVEAQL